MVDLFFFSSSLLFKVFPIFDLDSFIFSFLSQNELLTYLWYLNFEYTLRGLGVIQKFNNDNNND